MKRQWRWISGLMMATQVTAFAALADEAPSEPLLGGVTQAAWAEGQRSALRTLTEQIGQRPMTAAARIALTAEDQRSIARENAAAPVGSPPKVGLVKPLGLAVDLEPLDVAAMSESAYSYQAGIARRSAGRLVWAARVETAGSAAIRLHLETVALPEGAEIYLYNNDGEVRGPYGDEESSFWTHSISGTEIFIQVTQPADATESARLRIAEILMLDPSQQSHCSFNASCVDDGSCYGTSDWSQINNARAAIAHILFVEGSWAYICTGGLVNDTDTSSYIPYFLTANHCISTQAVASTMETYFNYRTSSCGGTCGSRGTPSTTGATLLDTSATDDHSLLRLSQTPPSGSWLLGWTSASIANSAGTMLYRLSHPQGAPQAYSTHRVDTSESPNSCGLTRGAFIHSRDVVGATEGGSSGSPVMLANGQIVGQLYGACGTNVDNVCDSANNLTIDGAFANYYSRISQWLKPTIIQPPAAGITIGLFNPGNSQFYLRHSNTTGGADNQFQFGSSKSPWLPLAGDWDGNGQTTIGLFNRANSNFYLRNSNSTGSANLQFQYGSSKNQSWIPLVGDWDGNGTQTVGFYNPSNANFYLRNSNSTGSANLQFQFGSSKNPHWIPLVGDWDGDGKDSIGLFNPTNSNFYLRNSNSTGNANLQFQFGSSQNTGWLPLAGDWDGDGKTTIGLFNPTNSNFYLRNANSTGSANLQFQFGSGNSGWKPLTGHWVSP